MRRWLSIIGLCLAAAAAAVFLFSGTEYHFRLEGTITFDGQDYKAIGFQSCTYQPAFPFFLFGGSDRHRLGGPILNGYRVTTARDSPSVILTDGRGAIV